MRRIVSIALAFVVLAGLSAWPKDPAKKGGSKSANKTVMLQGTVSADGKSFINDKDRKSWTVQNPEALKGHEGHHVSVSAHVYADKNAVHVMSVKMIAEGKAKKK